MPYLASQLIDQSWKLSGIVADGFETVDPDQASEGLFLLNSVLDMTASDLKLIPYFTRYSFSMVTNQERYFIPYLYEIESLTFNIGEVRYPMTQVSRINYFGSGRVDNISSLPFEYRLERQIGGSDLYVYYIPSQDYPANISGKFSLTNVTLNTDLSLYYDGFYISSFLRYSLAQLMCNENSIAFGDDKERTLMSYVKRIVEVSPPDLSIRKVSYFPGRVSPSWAQINIGKGYTP